MGSNIIELCDVKSNISSHTLTVGTHSWATKSLYEYTKAFIQFSSTFTAAVEQDRLVQAKRAQESGLDGKSGGKENAGDIEPQASQGDPCPVSPMSPTSPAANQVQSALHSPSPPKEGGYML